MGTAVAVVVAGAVIGIAGVTVGWVPPWGSRRVLRPRLWGYGTLVSTAGLGTVMILGNFEGPSSAYGALLFTGMAVFLVGLCLQVLAQRAP